VEMIPTAMMGNIDQHAGTPGFTALIIEGFAQCNGRMHRPGRKALTTTSGGKAGERILMKVDDHIESTLRRPPGDLLKILQIGFFIIAGGRLKRLPGEQQTQGIQAPLRQRVQLTGGGHPIKWRHLGITGYVNAPQHRDAALGIHKALTAHLHRHRSGGRSRGRRNTIVRPQLNGPKTHQPTCP
tara:strand:- start:117455 stop:118006 length:552 start_codon:yes stop_codon:yes gene_type:complete